MKEQEIDILNKVREATFANPFDRKRIVIDSSIAGLPAGSNIEKILEATLAKISETISTITARGETISSQQNSTEARLLRYGILFHVFHLFCKNYDEHIEMQLKTGDKCCQVPFARDFLSMLNDNEIGEKEGVRYLALFFQMRRAFFFISRITGVSPSVMNLRKSLWNNVFTNNIKIYNDFLWDRMEDFSTMILGETGTGKGMAAAAIGRSGFIPFDTRTNTFVESFAKTFIPINLSQFPEQLIESELFGHKKGAFTGAIETHSGVFSRCSPHGAIFLDEIGDVSIPIQIKLLQVLQERSYTPVGSHRSMKFPGRVIAATNKPLENARAKGEFRDDFYYRLCSDVIQVPPLRQRIAENPDELEIILERTIERILGSNSPELTASTGKYIRENNPDNYFWPGNIRELEQCVRGFLLNGHYRWQKNEHPHSGDQLLHNIGEGKLTANELLSHYCKKLHEQHGTYEAVAQLTKLDRRTVKKYIDMTSQLP